MAAGNKEEPVLWQEEEQERRGGVNSCSNRIKNNHRLHYHDMDRTEGPCRTPNPNFYALYPYRPELELAENKSLRYKVASQDAKEHFHLFVSNNWRRSLLPSAVLVQQTVAAALLMAPSVDVDVLDTLSLQSFTSQKENELNLIGFQILISIWSLADHFREIQKTIWKYRIGTRKRIDG